MNKAKQTFSDKEKLLKNELEQYINSFSESNYILNIVFKASESKAHIIDYVIMELYPKDINRSLAIKTNQMIVYPIKVFSFNKAKSSIKEYNRKRIFRYLNNSLKKSENNQLFKFGLKIRLQNLLNVLKRYNVARDYFSKDYSVLLIIIFIIIMLLIALVGAIISINGERNLGFYI